jgi:hypothetical protein
MNAVGTGGTVMDRGGQERYNGHQRDWRMDMITRRLWTRAPVVETPLLKRNTDG